MHASSLRVVCATLILSACFATSFACSTNTADRSDAAGDSATDVDDATDDGSTDLPHDPGQPSDTGDADLEQDGVDTSDGVDDVDDGQDIAVDTDVPHVDAADAPDDGAGDLPDDNSTADVPDDGVRRCNGHAELCDRPLDAIVFAGTHNAMGSREDDFFAPNQTHGLERQLDDGIRAMLLDSYEWNGRLALCHSSCELGVLYADAAMATIRSFLEANPNEVLLFIFQDQVSGDQSVQILEDAGLLPYVLPPPEPGESWPTLGELIDLGQRIVVTLESRRTAPDWFPHAWDVFFDTPYSFNSVEAFSCELNRGDSDNPLFLMNHWVSNPLSIPPNAERANAWDVLHTRARECEDRWGRPPTVIAVDFYELGDLFAVVDALNGVGDGELGR